VTEDVTTVHVCAGYIVGVLVLARIGWGFVGPRHARFSDFVTDPIAAIRYLWDLILARAKRYIGHSPAGGAMVTALLIFLAATVVTGLIRYTGEGAGPLATLYAQTFATTTEQLPAGEGDEGDKTRGESAFGEAHEVIANITLGLVIFTFSVSCLQASCITRTLRELWSLDANDPTDIGGKRITVAVLRPPE
jgi:cytochrome b